MCELVLVENDVYYTNGVVSIVVTHILARPERSDTGCSSGKGAGVSPLALAASLGTICDSFSFTSNTSAE